MSHREGRCRPCWPESPQSCNQAGALSHGDPVSRAEMDVDPGYTQQYSLFQSDVLTPWPFITLLTCSNTEGSSGTLEFQNGRPYLCLQFHSLPPCDWKAQVGRSTIWSHCPGVFFQSVPAVSPMGVLEPWGPLRTPSQVSRSIGGSSMST